MTVETAIRVSAMVFGVALVIVFVLGAVIEWYVWDRALYWHEDKRDPRNFPPR